MVARWTLLDSRLRGNDDFDELHYLCKASLPQRDQQQVATERQSLNSALRFGSSGRKPRLSSGDEGSGVGRSNFKIGGMLGLEFALDRYAKFEI